MIDILTEINNNNITLDQAYDIVDETIEKYHSEGNENGIGIMLGFNNYEWTAYCQSIDLQKLAIWRQDGWPKECVGCKSQIDYRKDSWIIKEDEINCLNCL